MESRELSSSKKEIAQEVNLTPEANEQAPVAELSEQKTEVVETATDETVNQTLETPEVSEESSTNFAQNG